MRRFSCLALILVLAACQLALPGGTSARAEKPVAGAAIVGGAITVTSLDGTSLDGTPAGQGALSPVPAPDGKPLPGAKPTVDGKPKADSVPAPVLDAKTDPKTTPDPAIKAEPEAPPPPPQSPEEIACVRKGGAFASVGESGGRACVTPTHDSGKRCRKESDCEGFCLARSNTCAPITPMFGCNDILQNDGRQVTLCID